MHSSQARHPVSSTSGSGLCPPQLLSLPFGLGSPEHVGTEICSGRCHWLAKHVWDSLVFLSRSTMLYPSYWSLLILSVHRSTPIICFGLELCHAFAQRKIHHNFRLSFCLAFLILPVEATTAQLPGNDNAWHTISPTPSGSHSDIWIDLDSSPGYFRPFPIPSPFSSTVLASSLCTRDWSSWPPHCHTVPTVPKCPHAHMLQPCLNLCQLHFRASLFLWEMLGNT